MKPVASGCERIDGGWRNEDALALQAASDPRPDYADVNPYALAAAAGAGTGRARSRRRTSRWRRSCAAHARLRAQADAVVVEGVGGWAAPLSATLDQADLVRALDLPVVLVVGLRLGCLNHAYLTARAIAADGCRLLGWIAQRHRSGMARADDNFALLRRAPAGAVLGPAAASRRARSGRRWRVTCKCRPDAPAAGPADPGHDFRHGCHGPAQC